MMHRSTPVGILVLALAGLIAVGCSAPTTAVLQALLAPAAAPESSPAVSAADPAEVGTAAATWWPHPEGYAMELPAGWSSMAVASDQTDELIATVAISLPGLASRISGVIDGTQGRISAIAAGPVLEGGSALVLVVLAQPTEGRRAREVKSHVREQIAVLPGLTSQPISAHDVVLDTAEAVRFDYTIDDPDLGEMRVRSYLFRFGRQAYLVNFVASADVAEEAEVTFDEIADSLRFGV
jgi:hypothetical protein